MGNGPATVSDLKVLIIEDQADTRAMIRNMLTEMGCTQIFEASDGRKGFQFVDSAIDFVDLVMCDWNMPGMTGMDLLRQLRTVDPDIPFLMVTGRSDMSSVMEAKASGVTAYITKPFSPTQLEAKLRIIVQRMRKAGLW